MEQSASPLETVRRRIDGVDAALLRLIDERASLAREVQAAKRAEAAGDPGFGLRPAREAQMLRRLLATPRSSASDQLVLRLWRELVSDSLAQQGPFNLLVYGGRQDGRTTELARSRFGSAPPLVPVARPEAALQGARRPGVVAVLALEPGAAWWGRLLAEPGLGVFAVLPCLASEGAPAALAVAAVDPEPSGADRTLWVTDAAGDPATIEASLGELGVVGDLIGEGGGLRLFALAGFLERSDARLDRAPGRLKGVIGAAPMPFDL